MSNTGGSHTPDALREKMLSYKVKCTTYLHGTNKNSFLLDCVRQGTYEAEHLRCIVSLYYEIIKEKPELKDKSFEKVREYVKDKLSY